MNDKRNRKNRKLTEEKVNAINRRRDFVQGFEQEDTLESDQKMRIVFDRDGRTVVIDRRWKSALKEN